MVNGNPSNTSGLDLRAMALEQLYLSWSSLDEWNTSLGNKLSTLVAHGGMTAGIVSGVAALGADRLDTAPEMWRAIGFLTIIASLGLFFLLVAVAKHGLGGVALHRPGVLDWDEIWHKRILPDPDEAFAQFMADVIDAIKANKEANRFMAKQLGYAYWMFVGQIACLVGFAVLVLIV